MEENKTILSDDGILKGCDSISSWCYLLTVGIFGCWAFNFEIVASISVLFVVMLKVNALKFNVLFK